jgi:lipoprotein-anchoring transpeptidase ErfK/SrfK
LISLFMSGPITGNWSGVAWTSLITGDGVAVHSTYWHNEFGVPRSHGCINVMPEDAKWIYRWTYPHPPIFPGEIDVSAKWPPVGTVVEVTE